MSEPQARAARSEERVPARGAVSSARCCWWWALADRDRRGRRTHAIGGGGEDPRTTATSLRGRAEQALAGATRALEPKA
jgi:hypothetical protein